ncbi:MAG: hypothetical protein P8Q48_18395 [Paracoccaceae bacterium]|nr:hypothetical protein [Paracoccaceae bacterium]
MPIDSIRKRISFAPQKKIERKDHDGQKIQNLIHRTDKAEEKWIEETTETIGAWRDISRSVYLRWAITINAMHVSVDHYKKLPSDRRLKTETIRRPNGSAEKVPLAIWTGEEASEGYMESRKLIAAYGFADMYGVLEDITFEAHKIFLRHTPKSLLKGKEYRDLHRKYKNRDSNPDVWEVAWSKRFEEWHLKKQYDGLHKVAKSYWTSAALRKPSTYEHTDITDWMDTIKMFGALRNHITHSAPNVKQDLSKSCNIKGNMGFFFEEGDQLTVELFHLMAIECFIDEYLTALNMSLLESVYG